jgi:hypothetical protein
LRKIQALNTAIVQEQKSLQASERQSKAALDASISASRKDTRAWVGVTSYTPPTCKDKDGTPIFLSSGCKGQFGANTFNLGKSPATDVVIKFRGLLTNTAADMPIREIVGDVPAPSSAVLWPTQMISS